MKKINLLLFFLLLACALPAQDGISVFIGRANRYASVELSDYRKRLCLEYNISNHSLDRCVQSGEKIPESRKEDSSIIVCDTVTTEDIDKRLEELQEKKCVMYATITSGIIVTGGTVSLWRLA